ESRFTDWVVQAGNSGIKTQERLTCTLGLDAAESTRDHNRVMPRHDDKKPTLEDRPPRVKRVMSRNREPNQTTRQEKGRQEYAPEQVVPPKKALIADVSEILTPDDRRRLKDEEQLRAMRELREHLEKNAPVAVGPPPPAPPSPKKR
ncbi:MAG TPA: hypothetical protein VFB32_01400, partial [Rudaea sp.]|nr:hypothetical protein [Rudaea sp.]